MEKGFSMKTVSIVLFVFCLFFAVNSISASDLYWISFNHHGTDDCFIMQIDALGNITIQPKVVFQDYHSHSTAITSNGGTQIFYYANAASDDEIRRGTVDKQTLAIGGGEIISFVVNASNGLQATQGASKFFLAFETSGDVLKGFGLTKKGKLDGSSGIRLSPRTDGANEEGGVSADGRMAFSLNTGSPGTDLYLQPLKANGIPTGLPSVVGSGDLDSADVSNVLAGNIRFAIFMDNTSNQVRLQRVDATTGAKIGGPSVIGTANPDHSDQMAAVDPLGRFVIYSDNAQPCAVSSMFYQALDATGNASGGRKELLGCAFQNEQASVHGIRGFDILKN